MERDKVVKQIEEGLDILTGSRQEQQPFILPESMCEVEEGLIFMFPVIEPNSGEDEDVEILIDLVRFEEGVYMFKVGMFSYIPVTEELLKKLLIKPKLIAAVQPYIQDGDRLVKAFGALEVVRTEFNQDDLEYFEELIDELEKIRIKQDTKLKMIEKLKQKGLSDEEIMELLKD